MRRRDFVKGLGAGVGAGGALAWLGCAPEEARSPDEPHPGPETRRAFLELLDLLAELDRRWLGDEWNIDEPGDVAAGHRAALHMLAGAIDMHFEADPERPRFTPIVSPIRKFLGDNPDARYYFARIRGDRSYRIRGRTAGAVYTSFTFQSGQADGAPEAIFATLNSDEFPLAPDGSYEITLSPDPPPPGASAWVQLDPAAVAITTRHYFENRVSAQNDRGTEPGLSIEPLVDPGPPRPLTPESVAERIRAAGGFLRSVTLDMPPRGLLDQPSWVSIIPNRMGKPALLSGESDGTAWGAVDNAYSMGPYLLDEDEALVIEGRMPSCRFANVVLWNRFLQTYDYERRQSSLNRRQMQLEPDGRFRVVVAGRDPGVPNWLDTGDRRFGMVFWRFQLPEQDPEALRTDVVDLRDLAAGAGA